MGEPKYCKSCGAYLPSGAVKCLACGLSLKTAYTAESAEEIAETTLDDGLHIITTIPKTPEDMLQMYVDTKIKKHMSRKPVDIDLDRILQQEFFSVKIGGKTELYYTGKADMEIGHTIYHTKDLFGRIVTNENGKKKFYLTLIER